MDVEIAKAEIMIKQNAVSMLSTLKKCGSLGSGVRSVQ